MSSTGIANSPNLSQAFILFTSVTVFRMRGGEATGDNGPLVVLDMDGAPHGGGDFISTGTCKRFGLLILCGQPQSR